MTCRSFGTVGGLALWLAACAISGCDEAGPDGEDAGSGAQDGSAPAEDAALDHDAGEPDAGEPDARADAGEPDAGSDSGPADTDDAGIEEDSGTDSGPTAPDPLEIAGDYVDGWGGTHQIDDATWVMGWTPDSSRFSITQYDNDAGFVIAQNAATNAWSPSLWSRFDFTRDASSQLWFCQTAYAAADEAAALATVAADPSSPSTTGCGSFSWSTLDAGQGPLAIVGDYTDGGATTHAIASDHWTIGGSEVHHISAYDNALRFVVAQNDTSNVSNPDLWSRFDWTWDVSGDLWYCASIGDAADEAAALAATAANPGDPANSGCGATSWALLTPDP